MYEFTDYLEHHGVLGMKWGVRRFQNKDGRYTQAGVKAWKESADSYASNKQKHKELKKELKSNTELSRKEKSHAVRVQKAKVKTDKRRMNRRYDLLKSDALADKGRIRYQEGARIRERNRNMGRALTAASVLATAGMYAAKNPKFVTDLVPKITTSKTIKYGKAACIAGVAAGGALAVGNIVTGKHNKEISAYYNHRYRR